ncbi:DUF58 domain-containing protein [Kiritimatiellaeota bacterium B1221]|nr:DUF58 domain-containing protein [Kiritimatiellaeota bacterium B1221]
MTADPLSARRLDARKCAGHLRLSLRERSWQGSQGNWAGAGTGSSIDFQDHRPYMPGDDPRYIDWAAYARSGQTIMKLYREEVSPRIDLVLDVSRSMFFDPAKAEQSHRVFFFCMESALSIAAALKVFVICGSDLQLIPLEQAMDPMWQPETAAGAETVPGLEQIPFRPHSMRILISDLLFDVPPDPLLSVLSAQKGNGVIFAPYLEKEQNPDWSGNMELLDCETGRSRRQRVDAGLLQRYRMAYARHLQSWQESSRRYQVRMSRIPCGVDLAAALESESLPQGVVETWG